MRRVICFSLLALATLSPLAAGAEPLPSIASLDVQRYLGTWYEIAKLPNWTLRHCASDIVTDFRLMEEDHTLSVTSRCLDENQQPLQANGIARQLGGPHSALMEISFAPNWLRFIPPVWGDYWVIDMDPAYQLAAISEPTRQSLWILARQPQVPAGRYQALLARLRRLGFDTDRLVNTAQHAGDVGRQARTETAP